MPKTIEQILQEQGINKTYQDQNAVTELRKGGGATAYAGLSQQEAEALYKGIAGSSFDPNTAQGFEQQFTNAGFNYSDLANYISDPGQRQAINANLMKEQGASGQEVGSFLQQSTPGLSQPYVTNQQQQATANRQAIDTQMTQERAKYAGLGTTNANNQAISALDSRPTVNQYAPNVRAPDVSPNMPQGQQASSGGQAPAGMREISPGVFVPIGSPADLQMQGTPQGQTGTPQAGTQQPAVAPFAGTTNLEPGMSGNEVKQLQEYLISQGYQIPAGATGFYGEQTKAAVAALQQALGVDTAGYEGYFGPKTRAAMSGSRPQIQAPEKSVLDSYGVSQDPQKAQDKPYQSYSDIVQQITKASGLTETKTKLDALGKELDDLDVKEQDAISEVNNNPWLSEAIRSKKISGIKEKYDNLRAGPKYELEIQKDLYTSAREDARFAATTALQQFNSDREFDQKQFEFAFEQAQKAAESKAKLLEDNPQNYKEVQGGLFNIKTGEWVIGPKAEGGGGGKLLSPTEALALGVPYGTTQEGAFGKTPEKPATDAQRTVAGYAARLEQSNPTISQLGASYISKLKPGQLGYFEKVPSYLQPSEYQQFDQAQRNFINATLRRESGAVISPSEFQNAKLQYLPQPGDSLATLKLKQDNRDLVSGTFKSGAGAAYQSVDELLGGKVVNTGKTTSGTGYTIKQK